MNLTQIVPNKNCYDRVLGCENQQSECRPEEDLLGKPHPSNASELKGHIDLDDKRDHTSSQGGVEGGGPKANQ